jgi:hypothetical protein
LISLHDKQFVNYSDLLVGTVPGAETFYDYRSTEYMWTLPHNTLSIADFQTINASLADENSSAFVIVDSYSKSLKITIGRTARDRINFDSKVNYCKGSHIPRDYTGGSESNSRLSVRIVEC